MKPVGAEATTTPTSSCRCGSDCRRQRTIHVSETEQTSSRRTATAQDYGADRIKVLEGLEAVRKRPAMYIGSTGPRGPAPPGLRDRRQLHRRGAGRLLRPRSTSRIHIDNSITVVDNGRGIPVGHARERPAGGRGRADRAARRRQVRQQQLQGLGRPARRRRRRSSTRCPSGSSSRSGATARSTSRATSAATRRATCESPARRKRRGTKVTFKPDDRDLRDHASSASTRWPSACASWRS